MVSGVQAQALEQEIPERGSNTRGADEDAAPLLGKPFPPQAAHRLLMVSKGGGGYAMTSIDRNGMTPPPGFLSSRRRRRAAVPATMPTQCSRCATRLTRTTSGR